MAGLAVVLAGCGVHAHVRPLSTGGREWAFDVVFMYARASHCSGPVPPQLQPVTVPYYLAAPKSPHPVCDVTEVGSMPWGNVIAAILTALATVPWL